jgi:protein SCO1/2
MDTGRARGAALARAGLLALMGLALAAGCARRSGDDTSDPGEKRYPLTGVVLSVDPAHRRLTVSHDAVAGLMPAMVMDFPVSAGDAALAKPNERIRAELVIDSAGAGRLEKIWPVDKVAEDTVAAGALQLRQDTHERGSEAYREIGENVPDFALYNQDGRVVQGGHFRGQQVMLNFIYTRCPLANMCPLSTAKMIITQRLAREAGIRNIQFVTITLDPAYDTPGVLREYADERGIDTGNFSLLTGPEGAIRDLLTQFGVIAEFEGGILKHTLATLLIDERGRIVWRADGSTWDPKDFVERMHKS